ncbi:MAG: PQQ-binding-like beta-propeller repeat protein [Haliscomenobacter sp.]|nr:PQQ-binding-like beta-propeller repeat protein [Haliscomenobacter sp.]
MFGAKSRWIKPEESTLPIGSPTYDFYGADRLGSNLFGNCLVAVDARTGKRLWHYQTVHHDLWDVDLASAPQLLTVNHGGKILMP